METTSTGLEIPGWDNVLSRDIPNTYLEATAVLVPTTLFFQPPLGLVSQLWLQMGAYESVCVDIVSG